MRVKLSLRSYTHGGPAELTPIHLDIAACATCERIVR